MINLFIPSKKTLFLILGLVVIIIVLFLLSLFSAPDQTLTPTPSPSTFSNPRLPAEPLTSEKDKAYRTQDLEKDFKRLTEKQTLAGQDLVIRNRLLSSLNGASGYLAQTDKYRIEYVKSPDLFMVEILSIDAENAKVDAENWFRDQGLSKQGICGLPVSFYLNSQVLRFFEENNIFFNPIPEGCE